MSYRKWLVTFPGMNRLKPGVDIVLDILKAVVEEQPLSTFAKSLLQQYQERGGLSRKQLEGLYGKARKIKGIPPNKLATLEAIILKKPQKNKSALPPPAPGFKKDESAGKMISQVLAKYPEHKRVLFLQLKYENNELLSSSELAELQKFSRLATPRD